MRYLAHAGLHLNPHPPEPVLLIAIGCAVVALIAIGVIRWLRRPSDCQTPDNYELWNEK